LPETQFVFVRNSGEQEARSACGATRVLIGHPLISGKYSGPLLIQRAAREPKGGSGLKSPFQVPICRKTFRGVRLRVPPMVRCSSTLGYQAPPDPAIGALLLQPREGLHQARARPPGDVKTSIARGLSSPPRAMQRIVERSSTRVYTGGAFIKAISVAGRFWMQPSADIRDSGSSRSREHDQREGCPERAVTFLPLAQGMISERTLAATIPPWSQIA